MDRLGFVILDDGQPVAVQASQLWVGRLGPFARTMAAAATARFGPPVLHDHDPQLLTAAQRLLGRLHDELLRRGLATAAHARQELQDQFDRAVAHMVSAILTARRREHRPVIPEPLTTVASQAAVNALTKLSVVRQFDDLLRATRILAVMVCPDPEHHRAVVLYCLSPLEKNTLSDATRQALSDSLPRGWRLPGLPRSADLFPFQARSRASDLLRLGVELPLPSVNVTFVRWRSPRSSLS